mmetsp:Transcript_17334/g.31821  ORF Transcript_17334/g.31821 Transcript_17334/m.31821 type:complete len:103 (+) Transcript_17334:296-604(+)
MREVTQKFKEKSKPGPQCTEREIQLATQVFFLEPSHSSMVTPLSEITAPEAIQGKKGNITTPVTATWETICSFGFCTTRPFEGPEQHGVEIGGESLFGPCKS